MCIVYVDEQRVENACQKNDAAHSPRSRAMIVSVKFGLSVRVNSVV